MIKFENTCVDGWEAAIRGMRNPMNSWEQSDSYAECDMEGVKCCGDRGHFVIGENDLKLMLLLVKAGSDHSKFMRMINVTVDITAPLYWWKESDTYKVGTVRNSCSTMHKIHAKEFTKDDFSHEWLRNMMNETTFIDNISYIVNANVSLNDTIDVLNCLRKNYINTKDKKYWYQMIQLLPSSYNQRATIQMNYAVLRNMYHSRKNHKLDEWSVGFVEWVETLPYSELITCDFKEEK